LLGDGQTIAIYSEDNYNYSDIALYANKSGLSALRPFLGQGTQDPYPITNTVDCNQQALTGCGGGGGICTGCLPHAVFSAEAVTDIDVAMSVAPHAAIYNYQNGNYLAGADGFLWGAASQAVPFGQITSSYRGDYDGNGGQAIEALVARGTTYFYATGDGGAFSSAYPYNYGVAPSLAGLAGVGATLVGATALVANYPPKGTPFLSETCLPQSTGGILGGGHISGYDAWNWGDPYTGPVETPGFQLDYVDSSNTSISYTFRNVPDVSAIGANATYYLNGAPNQLFGTSVAAPFWAGFMALANQQSNTVWGYGGFGWVDPLFYAIGTFNGSPCPTCPTDLYTRSFNDIKDGCQNNDYVGQNGLPGNAEAGFSSVLGYDLVTGLGSPRCGLLQQMVAGESLAPLCPAGQSGCTGSACCADGNCQTSQTAGASSLFPPLQTDVCCPSLSSICGGTQCCQASEVCCADTCCQGNCSPSGQCCDGQFDNNGNCCSLTGTVCLGSCCNGQCASNGEGQCCDSTMGQSVCGTTCCSAGYYCTDPSLGICSACTTPGTSVCTDENGTSMCCNTGAECCNGTCCATGAICCNLNGVYECSVNCTQ
jgi:hypothetical protein